MACTISDALAGFYNDTITVRPGSYPTTFVTSSQGTVNLHTPLENLLGSTDASGQFSFTLPWPSEVMRGGGPWRIILPTGDVVTGTVPEGVSGPLTITQLVTIYSWVRTPYIFSVVSNGGGNTPATVTALIPSGDTTGATDTAAIQAALNAAPSQDGVVFLKSGTGPFWVNATLQLPGGVRLDSFGSFGAAMIKVAAGTVLNGAVIVSAAWATNSTTSGPPVSVRNICVHGNGVTGHGILLMNYNSDIQDCDISTVGGSGIVLTDQNSAGTTISNTEVECRIVNNKINFPLTHGIWVQDHNGSGKITDGYMQNNIVANSGDVAIRNERAAGWFIDNNHVYACGNGAAPGSLATVAGAGGYHLTNMWDTFVTNNEVDGYGAVSNGGTHIAFNFEMIPGRESIMLGNSASANEGLHTASSYLYFRWKVATTSASVSAVADNNIAHCDSTGGASSIYASFQPNSGTLTMVMGIMTVDGPSTTPTIGTPGTVRFAGSSNYAPGGVNDLYDDYGNRAAAVVETMSRDAIDPTSGAPSPSAGTLALTYFTPDQTVTVSTLSSASRGTAQAGATLAKMALFSVDSSGNLTCIARTASDTTLWQTTQTLYSRAIVDDGAATPNSISSVTLQRGQRYAFSVLHVGSTTAPTLAGKGGIAGLLSATPRRGGYATAQTDIPANITAATINGNVSSGNYYYGRAS